MKAFLAKAVKFLLVGCLNTLVDLAVFNAVLFFAPDGRGWTVAATVAGYCCGIVCSYVLNKSWTFKKGGNLLSLMFIKFIAVNLTSLAAKTAVSWVLADKMPDVLFVSGENVVWFVGTCLTLLINFFGSYFFAFAEKKSADGKNAADDTARPL